MPLGLSQFLIAKGKKKLKYLDLVAVICKILPLNACPLPPLGVVGSLFMGIMLHPINHVQERKSVQQNNRSGFKDIFRPQCSLYDW